MLNEKQTKRLAYLSSLARNKLLPRDLQAEMQKLLKQQGPVEKPVEVPKKKGLFDVLP